MLFKVKDSKMTQWVKVFAVKPDYLRLIPGICMTEGENQLFVIVTQVERIGCAQVSESYGQDTSTPILTAALFTVISHGKNLSAH